MRILHRTNRFEIKRIEINRIGEFSPIKADTANFSQATVEVHITDEDLTVSILCSDLNLTGQAVATGRIEQSAEPAPPPALVYWFTLPRPVVDPDAH